jgi:hypothetical protein
MKESPLVVFAVNQDMHKCFFLCVSLAYATVIFGGVVEDGLSRISLKDQINMNFFFDEAIKKDQAAHVLFFQNKPACLTGPVLKGKNKNFKETLCLKGWLAFKKNEHLFPHPNFLFNENMYDSPNFKVLDIYIINKKSLKRCVTEHLSIFKETLGQEFSADQFISQLEKGVPINSLLNKDEMLIGLILGYGEESSKAFKGVRTKCTQTFAPPPTESYQRIEIEQPRGCKIGPVIFMGNPKSSQVKTLVSVYEKELEEISKIYGDKKDSLKRVLEKLCEK